LAFQVGPGPDQSALLVVERGQFDLQAAFAGARTGPEYFQNETGAVDHLAVPFAFEVALLARREVGVDDDDLDFKVFQIEFEVGEFAGADQRGRSRFGERNDLGETDVEINRLGEAHSFFEGGLGRTSIAPRATDRGVKDGRRRPRVFVVNDPAAQRARPCGLRVGVFGPLGVRVEKLDRLRRHDGGNGMFVNELNVPIATQ